MLENYIDRYQKRGKYIFTPNEECKKKGERLLKFFKGHEFPRYFFHYRPGGHVAALHLHVHNNHFFKIDLKNFFYSISRNRAAEALRTFGFKPARTFARWSSVRESIRERASICPSHWVQAISANFEPRVASFASSRWYRTSTCKRRDHDGVF